MRTYEPFRAGDTTYRVRLVETPLWALILKRVSSPLLRHRVTEEIGADLWCRAKHSEVDVAALPLTRDQMAVVAPRLVRD